MRPLLTLINGIIPSRYTHDHNRVNAKVQQPEPGRTGLWSIHVYTHDYRGFISINPIKSMNGIFTYIYMDHGSLWASKWDNI